MTVDALKQLVDLRNRLKDISRESCEMQVPLPEDISSALGMIVDAEFVLNRAVKRLIADYDAHALEIGGRQ